MTDASGNRIEVKPLPDGLEIVNSFYSNIEKKILETKNDSLKAEQWIEKFGKNNDETNYTGMLDFLESKGLKNQVKKNEVLDFIKNNRIEIVEKIKENNLLATLEDLNNDLSNGGEPYSFPVKIQEGVAEYIEEEINEFGDIINSGQYILVNKNAIEEITKKDLNIEPTNFYKYQLDDKGENYREVLITLPNQKTLFKSSHFDEPNILAHLRMNERTDDNGNKVLFLEEVQSDWGQKGGDEGFEKIFNDKQKRFIEFNKKNNKTPNFKEWMNLEYPQISETQIELEWNKQSNYVEE